MASTPDKRKERKADPVVECRLMLRFARESGMDFTADLVHDIAELDHRLVERGFAPISDADPLLIKDDPAPEIQGPAAPTDELLLLIQNRLAAVVAPATPASLEATEPGPGRLGFLRGVPFVVTLAFFVASVSAGGFVWSAWYIAKPHVTDATKETAKSAAAKKPDAAVEGGSQK